MWDQTNLARVIQAHGLRVLIANGILRVMDAGLCPSASPLDPPDENVSSSRMSPEPVKVAVLALSKVGVDVWTALGGCNACMQAFLLCLRCEDGHTRVIDPDSLRVLPENLAFCEPTGGEHPTSSPLDAPKIDFFGNHDRHALMLYETSVYWFYIHIQAVRDQDFVARPSAKL